MTNWTLTIVCESYSLSDCNRWFGRFLLLSPSLFCFRTWLVQNTFWTGRRKAHLMILIRPRRANGSTSSNSTDWQRRYPPSRKRLDQIFCISCEDYQARSWCVYTDVMGERGGVGTSQLMRLVRLIHLRFWERNLPARERSKARLRTCADRCCVCRLFLIPTPFVGALKTSCRTRALKSWLQIS